MTKKGLGRGLGSLISVPSEAEQSVREIALQQISVNSGQPRRNFDEQKIQELGDSIRIHGVVQPIVVRSKGTNTYEVIAGERRYRACKLIGLQRIPVVIRNCSDQEMAEIALIENIQRENLDPIEEANAIKTLLEVHKFTQEVLAERIGKSRSVVSNLMRLLSLPVLAQRYLSEGRISVGHAKVLLALEEPTILMLAVEKVVRSGLSVRDTELLVKNIIYKTQEGQPVKLELPEKQGPNSVIPQIEDRLRSLLKTQVKIKDTGSKGKIEIEYYSKDELSQIVDILLGELC